MALRVAKTADLEKPVERVALRRFQLPRDKDGKRRVAAVGDTVKIPLRLANLLNTKVCMPDSDSAKGVKRQAKQPAAK